MYFLLYDPSHLLKNIRNNWHMEKMQKFNFVDPEDGKTVIARWSDLVEIYRSEEHPIVKSTRLNYNLLHKCKICRIPLLVADELITNVNDYFLDRTHRK